MSGSNSQTSTKKGAMLPKSNIASGTANSTVSPAVSTAPVKQVRSSTKDASSYSQMFANPELALGEQAIDESLNVGSTNERPIHKLRTPNGVQEVISFGDDSHVDGTLHDYLPHYKLPEQGFVWSSLQTISVPNTSTSTNITPNISNRTRYLMSLCKFYSSHIIVRLMCKPALTQSQIVWVSRNFSNSQTSSMLNNAGFSWNLSKSNEVYVLLPWSSVHFVESQNEPLANIFGSINIQPLSGLLYSEGNEVPLQITMQCCPYNMFMYYPQVIDSSAIRVGTYTLQGAALPNNVFGTLTTTETIRIVATRTTWTPASQIAINLVTSPTKTELAFANNGDARAKVVTVLPGTYDIEWWASVSQGPYVEFTYIYVNNAPVFAPVEPPTVFKEQIMEYNYNPNSYKGVELAGDTNTSSDRDNHHLQFLQTYNITATNKAQIQGINLSLSAVNSSNMREYKRHHFKSHMPNIIVRGNKTPFSNVFIKIVQSELTELTDDQFMQLPGFEWDPAVTDLKFQPYWNSFSAIAQDIQVRFFIKVISGQVDDVGMSLSFFFNVAPLDYHVRVDYQPISGTRIKRLEDGICEGCYLFPCHCKFVEQMEDENLTVAEEKSLGNIAITEAGDKPPADVVSISPDVMPVAEDKVVFNFVSSFQVDVSKVKAVTIPLKVNNFGKQHYTQMSKYHLWRGNPVWRITTNSSSLMSGMIFVGQAPSSFDISKFSEDSFLHMFPHVSKTIQSSPLEFQTVWSSVSPMEKVILPSNSNAFQYNLVLIFPFGILSNVAESDPNLKITLECAIPNLTLARPTFVETYQWPGMSMSSVLRNEVELDVFREEIGILHESNNYLLARREDLPQSINTLLSQLIKSHKNYKSYQDRIDTFEYFPQFMNSMFDMKQWAAAGFVYSDRSDHVQCIFCTVTLKHLEPRDDAWKEHALWSPECLFIKAKCTPDFIKACSNPSFRYPNKSHHLHEVSFQDKIRQAKLESFIDGCSEQIENLDYPHKFNRDNLIKIFSPMTDELFFTKCIFDSFRLVGYKLECEIQPSNLDPPRVYLLLSATCVNTGEKLEVGHVKSWSTTSSIDYFTEYVRDLKTAIQILSRSGP